MMETPFALNTPAKLYALHLKLRPLQYGTLMPFSGELVHGAFLTWLRETAPDVVAWLHEGQKQRLFTCSSLLFPYSAQRMIAAERENTHLPLDPEQTYTLRITLLLGDLFPLFYETLIRLTTVHQSRATGSPFFRLGKQFFLLEEVQLTNDTSSDWTGFISLAELIEQARQARFGRAATLALEFVSLTTFSRGNPKRGYGAHALMLPLENYLQEDGVIIVDYNLTAHHVHFTTHRQRGFLGSCTYELRGPDEPPTAESPLTLRQQILLLSLLAFYTGIGYKTAMGLGQTRLKE
jgi:hypothetical protein